MSEKVEPSPELAPGEHVLDRRTVLEKWIGISLVGLGSAALAVPILGYLLGPLIRRKEDQWVTLRPIMDFPPDPKVLARVTDFPPNQTVPAKFANPDRQPLDGETGYTAAYVRRLTGTTEADFKVFAVFCTHLGCPVSWFPQSGLFLCPCHGGVYYANGDHASGPPPRGLYVYDHRINAKGELEILAGHLPTLQNTLKKET